MKIAPSLYLAFLPAVGQVGLSNGLSSIPSIINIVKCCVTLGALLNNQTLRVLLAAAHHLQSFFKRKRRSKGATQPIVSDRPLRTLSACDLPMRDQRALASVNSGELWAEDHLARLIYDRWAPSLNRTKTHRVNRAWSMVAPLQRRSFVCPLRRGLVRLKTYVSDVSGVRHAPDRLYDDDNHLQPSR